ncbi:unnamed protein product [marine sediment metagenome]|uniref:Uncharacterized protein n=1 Tax=marine sediment metagenome TaxID=412755 RepID=X0ZKS2_9ZZZZ
MYNDKLSVSCLIKIRDIGKIIAVINISNSFTIVKKLELLYIILID